jgi:hypothetical protein
MDNLLMYLIGLILTISNAFFWYIINELKKTLKENKEMQMEKNCKFEKQIENMNKDVSEIKDNYISRFEDLRELMFNNTKEILTRIDEFKLLVVEHYQKKTDCRCK